MSRKLALVVVLLLLLLMIGFFVLFLSSRPTSQPEPPTASPRLEPSARDSTRVAGEFCCETLANPNLKDQGRVVVAFPAGLNLSNTMVYVYQPGASTQLALSTGSGIFAVAPGLYDVEVQKVRLTGVPVKAGYDTRVKVGALRVTAGNATTYRVLDEAQLREVAKGYGKSVFGLLAGRYVLKLRQRDEPVTITDGTVTEY